LLRLGKYRDYAEAISVAIANQLILHHQVGESRYVVVEGSAGLQQDVARAVPVPDSTPPIAATLRIGPAFIPMLFRRNPELQNPPFGFATCPADHIAMESCVPVESWFFGQHNRLLPVKASVRALTNLLALQPGGVMPEKVGAQIAQDASRLGDFLRSIDRSAGTTRDEALATAFPSSGPDTDRGRLRFANQFVASINSQGELSGLLYELKLVNFAHEGSKNITLTEAGWRFAMLFNPLLDGLAEQSDGVLPKFNPPERSFLLEHISSRVPTERFAYKLILESVDAGANTPDLLGNAIKHHVSEPKTSDAFITTQKTGALSRMLDLGLLNRKRDGLRVSYRITETGKTYLSKSSGSRDTKVAPTTEV